MAAELERAFSSRVELIRGGGGIFDVTFNGRVVFSKHLVGRFPEIGEVEAAIRALGSANR